MVRSLDHNVEDSFSPESGAGKTPGLRESSTLCYCVFMASFITRAEVLCWSIYSKKYSGFIDEADWELWIEGESLHVMLVGAAVSAVYAWDAEK